MNIKRLIIASLLVILPSAPLQASVPSLVLQTQANPIRVGDTFDVDIIVHDAFVGSYADDLLLAFGFGFDDLSPALLGLNTRWVNPLFSDDSELLGTDLAGSAFPGLAANDVSGDLHLATLRFEALAEGAATLTIAADPIDPNQGLIYLIGNPVTTAASLNLNIAAVPLPPSALLFVSGAWLTWRRKLSNVAVRPSGALPFHN